MKTTRNSVLMILLIIIVMVLVIGLVACNKEQEYPINRNYPYQRASYEAANGLMMTVDIIDWRLDDTGYMELTQVGGKKILVHSTKVILYTKGD